MTESHSSFCSQWKYISHACKMMFIITPGKNENMPQASCIHPSQRTFYPTWQLKQSNKCFFSQGFKSLQKNEGIECESPTVSVSILTTGLLYKKTILAVSVLKDETASWSFTSTGWQVEFPKIQTLGKCQNFFFGTHILNCVTLWGKTKIVFSTPRSHSYAYLACEKSLYLPSH